MISAFINLVLVAGLATGTTPKVDVAVRPVIEVASAQVSLGDVATVRCSDAQKSARLKRSPLCTAPLAGKSVRISRDQIRISIRRQGLEDRAINLICPADITVTRASTRVSGQALFEAARDYAASFCNWPGAVIIEPVRLAHDQVVPTGKLDIRVRSGMQKPRRGINNIPITLVVDGKTCRNVNVPIQIRVFAQALTSTQLIARGTALSAANVTLKQTEITNMPDDIILDSAEESTIAAIPIAAGVVIKHNWITQPSVVKSGDNVVVVVNGTAITIRDKGIASQDGRIGDRVKVKLAGDSRDVRGTVTGPGLVEIEISKRS